MKTTKVTLSWYSPEPGKTVITFPAEDRAEIEGLHQYLRAILDTEYGDSVAKISQKDGEGRPRPDAWKRLATALRYDTGEEVYAYDIPNFKDRGILRLEAEG